MFSSVEFGCFPKIAKSCWAGRYTAEHDQGTGKTIWKSLLLWSCRISTRNCCLGNETGKGAETYRYRPTEGCTLPELEHEEMKTLPIEQLTSFLWKAKESGVFEMYSGNLSSAGGGSTTENQDLPSGSAIDGGYHPEPEKSKEKDTRTLRVFHTLNVASSRRTAFCICSTEC